ncbi:MAG: hypothetical protein HFJ38_00430 [Bacilli bacterium]|nr:hypothetical protein [Bacilli bacterium]
MEKRKFKIDILNNEEIEENKETYTFVIPNSSFENINIAVKKEEKNREKKKDENTK